MNESKTPAQDAYRVARESLEKFCASSTELTPYIIDDQYPTQVQFVPNPQLSVFGNENIDENGEVNELTVTVGLSVSVTSTLKFKMDSALLKKLIKLAEEVGALSYHAFKEEHTEKNTPTRPDGTDDFRYCPACGELIPQDDREPDFCRSCGQALDWTTTADEFAAGLEKLRKIVDEKEAAE